jgi:outer membrane protein OmpA-like peptidoglycan-associated protein
MIRLRPLPLLAASAALSLAAPAAADVGFALPRFEPSFAGDALFGVPSPGAVGDGEGHAMVLVDYAHDPLLLRDKDTGKSLGAIVGVQVLAHADFTLALWGRLALNLDLPVGFQHGDGLPVDGQGVTPSTVGLGDLRAGARAALVGESGDSFQLALGALVWLPTGARAAFLGDGTARSEPQLILGGVTRWVTWSAMVGAELRTPPGVAGVVPGSGVRWGAGLGFHPGDGDGGFQIGPEIQGGTTLAGSHVTDAEVLLGARQRFAKSFVIGLATAFGLTSGAGTPDVRSVLSFSYSPEAPRPAPAVVAPTLPAEPVIADRDHDGIRDAEDACPDVPGVPDVVPKLNGCPPDRDNDGIPDAEDACPDEIGPRDPDPKKNGCPVPPDRDGDGIPDTLDACPDTPGSPSHDPKKNGCPGDRDGDGIYDDKDACPDEKGPPDPDPAKNGCPRDVRVSEGQIVLLQQVEFDVGKATIRPVSNPLLDAVAGVLREHPEIAKVEVGGHTDNRGLTEENTRLSQQRAEAVMAALVKRGIARGRLTAKGYGPTRPIMANLTTLGRQKNRRVELRIVERRGKDDVNEPYRK